MQKRRRNPITHIAQSTGLHTNTIRRYIDRGLIESKRDFRGWRYIPNPDEAIAQINALLEGKGNLSDGDK